MRDVTNIYDLLGLYSADSFTRELQPHTLETITDLKKFTITTGLVFILLIMLLLLLRDLLTSWKRGNLLGYIWLFQITENLQIEVKDSTKVSRHQEPFYQN